MGFRRPKSSLSLIVMMMSMVTMMITTTRAVRMLRRPRELARRKVQVVVLLSFRS